MAVDARMAKAFGLEGDAWLRHANPWSFWTRPDVPFVARGLGVRDGWMTLFGLALQSAGKLWSLDRMARLYDDATPPAPTSVPEETVLDPAGRGSG